MTKNLIVFAALLATPGCGGGTSPAADARTGDAELGTGMVAFEEIVAGQDLGLVAGPQGGFHFLAHARMSGLEPGDPDQLEAEGNPLTSFEVFDADGVRIDVMAPPRRLGYEPVGDGRFVLPSARILQIQNESVPAVFDTTVRITLRIEDVTGAVGTDQVTVNVVPAE